MNTKLIILIIVAFCLILETEANGQIARKAGGYVFRKVIGETGKATAEHAGKAVISKAAKSLGKSAISSAARKASAHGVSKAASGIATSLAKQFGDDAFRVVGNVSAQSSRRLSAMAPEITKSGHGSKLMKVLAERSDANKLIDVIFKHRKTLAGGAILAAVIANPDEVLGAASDSVATVVRAGGREIVLPLAQNVGKPIAHWFGFAMFSVGVVAFGCWMAGVGRTSLRQEDDSEATAAD